MKEAGKISLKVETKIETKPILYGTAPNSGLQDYALTSATYEDGTGNIKDEYFKNETKSSMLKKLQNCQSASKINLALGVDEEGGTVTRLSYNSNLVESKILSPRTYYNEGGIDKILEVEVDDDVFEQLNKLI